MGDTYNEIYYEAFLIEEKLEKQDRSGARLSIKAMAEIADRASNRLRVESQPKPIGFNRNA